MQKSAVALLITHTGSYTRLQQLWKPRQGLQAGYRFQSVSLQDTLPLKCFFFPEFVWGFEAHELLRSAGDPRSKCSGINLSTFPATPPSWPSHFLVTSPTLCFEKCLKAAWIELFQKESTADDAFFSPPFGVNINLHNYAWNRSS